MQLSGKQHFIILIKLLFGK